MDWDTAKRLVQEVEDAFGVADLARIEQGFTEDAITQRPELTKRPVAMHKRRSQRNACRNLE